MAATTNAVYLGDGVYADFQNGQVMIWVSDGVTHSNVIFLESQVFANLMIFGHRMYAPPEVANDL